MKVTATISSLRISPRKVRLVLDAIRGKKVDDALQILALTKKQAAQPIAKLVRSAVANAEHNFKLDKKDLFIKTITADEGQVLKRFKPRAFGRASAIRKRASHIHVVLDERKEFLTGKKK
ncbi:MAG: 50S ribosomal protein L22 [Candidatus Kerfeldbacteria bacterium]|nr:50S ribosomal protein L22 [Candidatus Kerfeldbacteria bacterium]